MKFQKILWLSFGAVMAGSLAACSGVGNGSKPDHMEISQTQGLLGVNSNKTFVCFPEPLTLSIVFDNGRFDSSFATRATWTSSNPEVAAVSNGDILYPGSTTLAYGAGVVVPNQPGTTTITASFASLSASYQLTVETPSAFSVDKASVSLVKHTSAPINAKAVVEGYTRTVTTFGTWSFTDQDGDEATGRTTVTDTTDNPLNKVVQLASSSSGVSLVAGDTLGTRTVQMALNCPDGSTAAAMAKAALKVPVNVRELKSLAITPEFPASQALNVMTYGDSVKPTIVNTTETIKVIAGFGDGVADTQDLSSQVTLQSSDATVVAPVIGYVSALKAGTANITASFPIIGVDGKPAYDDVDPVTSAPITITAGERTFKSLAIAPADEQTLTALDDLQYAAIVTFADDSTQDITRHVLWSVSDASVAAIGNNQTIKAGDLFSLQIPTAGPVSINVTATLGNANAAPTATVPLKIQALE